MKHNYDSEDGGEGSTGCGGSHFKKAGLHMRKCLLQIKRQQSRQNG